MADADADRLKGASGAVTLDHVARTLTFEHRGWLRSKEQKKSPIVVPLDDIESVEYKWGTITGWFRIRRRGQDPWKGVSSDPHGLTTSVDPTEFAKRVQAAAGIVERPAPQEAPAEQPDADSTEAEAEPKPDGKMVKAVDGVLDLFSKFN